MSLEVIGIIPLDRSGKIRRESLFSGCHEALDNEQILLIFPEGNRGKPEEMSRLKKGLHYLVKDRDDTNITPVVMHGLGRSPPRGEALFTLFNCDVIVGEPIERCESSKVFLEKIFSIYKKLFEYCLTKSHSV